MYDEVTHYLAMTSETPVAAIEFSRATSIEGYNAVMFEAWALSTDGAFDSLVVRLEGSNDLCNWEPNILNATLTTAPAFIASAASGRIPWKWVRLRFEAEGSDIQIAIRGAIRALVLA